MNKEQQEVLDDAYNRYRATIIKEFYEDTKELRKWATVEGPGGHTKKEFINKCKTDTGFSERWGLKIEERELSLSERGELFRKTYPGKSVDDFAPSGMEVQSIRHQLDTRYNKSNIPTKLNTIIYNDKTIESYE
jgi:hypothetical protein